MVESLRAIAAIPELRNRVLFTLGMLAVLVDRDDRFPEHAGRIPDLFALPAALGLVRPGADG